VVYGSIFSKYTEEYKKNASFIKKVSFAVEKAPQNKQQSSKLTKQKKGNYSRKALEWAKRT